MKIERLTELKQKLVQEKEFSRVWSFYMDNFADHTEFTDLGEPVKAPFLESVVRQICQQLFGRKIKVSQLLSIYIAEYKFFHAPFQAEGRPGGVIYFEEANMGLLAVSADFPDSGEVKYSRFSAAPMPKKTNSHDYN